MKTEELNYAVVRVPGSTSNLGPGFDCMGLALRLYNEVRVERGAEASGGESPEHPMVKETAERFFAEVGGEPFAFRWSIGGEVPMSRGLGSSVTLRQGILQGLNVLVGQPLSREDLFRVGTELEGHPDNASAGVYGGFTCSNASGRCAHFPVDPSLKFLLLIPDREVLTDLSRGALPETLPHREAVTSLGNACVITAAMASGNYGWLKGSFGDGLHQPFREAANPGLREVISAGEAAGALGGFLSGSGSTIACVALEEGEALQRIGAAMQGVYEVIGQSRLVVCSADNEGAQTVERG